MRRDVRAEFLRGVRLRTAGPGRNRRGRALIAQNDMWLAFRDKSGLTHKLHWIDLPGTGIPIDPDTGNDMTLVGWTLDPPT